MKLNVAVCDDDANMNNYIKELTEHYSMEGNNDLSVTQYSNPLNLLNDYTNNIFYDVVFLDVEMPELSGIELARKLRHIAKNKTEIIFVSSYPDYMQESFGVRPYYYLKKPFTASDFENVLNKLVDDLLNVNIKKMLISSDSKDIVVDINDMLYIEVVKGRKRYLNYHLTDNTLCSKGDLKELTDELFFYDFHIAYRGILVNINHIRYFENNFLVLTNNEKIPVGRSYQNDLRNVFAKKISS